MERRRLRVYVAGPISTGDTFENVHRGIAWGRKMVQDGLAPYVPHFDSFMFAGTTVSWNAYLEWDFEWAVLAEAVFRLDGESKGADREVELAEEQGIPVFYETTRPMQWGYLACPDSCCGYTGLLEWAEDRNLLGVRR